MTNKYNPRFNGERNQSMDLVAKLIAQKECSKCQDKEKIDAQLDKLRMADAYIESYQHKKVAELANGAIIMCFNADGLVDNEKDWEVYYREYYHDKTFRVYGLGEYLENKNFRVCARQCYGLFELIRDVPYFDSYDIKTRMVNGEEKAFNMASHRVLILDENGNIVVNEVNENTENRLQFSLNKDWYYDSMKRMRQPIIDHVIEHGPEPKMVGIFERELYSPQDYSEDDERRYTYMNCMNSLNDKYQLMRMGNGEATAFVLFDIQNKKCLASGNGVSLINGGNFLGLPVDDSVIVFSREMQNIYKYKMDTAFLMEYIRKEGKSPTQYQQMLKEKQDKIRLSVQEIRSQMTGYKLKEMTRL